MTIPNARPRVLPAAFFVPVTLVLAGLAAPPALAGTAYVNAGLGSGANNGSSWANAYQGATGLQSALAAAIAGDQVWVAQGTYKPTATSDRTLSFNLKNGVEVYGGFVGGETLLSQRDPVAHVTILSADLAGDDGSALLGENSYHVVRGSSASASAVLDGFRITGGNANGSSASNDDRGGAFLMLAASNGTIRRCVVVANRCTFGGGAGYVNSSSPTFTDTVFDGNLGGSFGGAFDTATNALSVFKRCVFRNNSAARAGALEMFSGSSAQVHDCLFHGNSSTGSGGGGAIYIASSSPTIRGCTIVANSSAVNATAGILLSGGGTTIANTILYFNTGPGGAQASVNQISGAANSSYSCVQGGLAGTGNISVDPQLVNVGGGDFRVQGASPCADAGSNAAVPAGTTIDLAGNARFADAPAAPNVGAGVSPIVDMGAYERPNDLYTLFCFGDGSLPTPCPCGNTGSAGHGCLASDIFSIGAALSAAGAASPDTVTLTATEMLPSVPCIFLQGDAEVPTGAPFGDGVRCVGGVLKRLAVKTASGGTAVFPQAGDPSISARSAALGDTIAPGSTRWYQTYYRDPDPIFCPVPTGNTWNVTSGVILQW